jgi:hypothetical protein
MNISSLVTLRDAPLNCVFQEYRIYLTDADGIYFSGSSENNKIAAFL